MKYLNTDYDDKTTAGNGWLSYVVNALALKFTRTL